MNEKKYNFIVMSRKQYLLGIVILLIYIFLFPYLTLAPVITFFCGNMILIDDLSSMTKTIIAFIALIVLLKDKLLLSFKDFINSNVLNNLKLVFRSFLVIFGIRAIYVIISMLLKAYRSDYFGWMLETKASNQIRLDEFGMVYPIFYMVITILIAPIAEELMFRYILYHWLRKVNVYFAIIATSIIFAGLHVFGDIGKIQFIQVLYYFIDYWYGAVVITVLYEKRKNIIVCILLHMFINIIAKL